jgi:formylglycine-generating enzyme required for sulfatase activity
VLSTTNADLLYESAIRGEKLDIYALADFLEEEGEFEKANDLRGSAPTISLPITDSMKMKFAWVPPGESWLGGGSYDGRYQERKPQPGDRHFTLEHPLWCGIYPVTQAEWKDVMGNNPSRFADNPTHPVEMVSLDEVEKFLAKLNQERSGRGHVFRLPTEWEWEYICRGGPLTKRESKYDFYFAKSKTDLTPVRSNDLSSHQANFDGRHPAGNAKEGPNLQRTSPVGSYLPNPLGIYDLHGNVREWTSTVVEDEPFSYRVVRGGCWDRSGQRCTAAFHDWNGPGIRYNYIGFRLLAEVKP